MTSAAKVGTDNKDIKIPDIKAEKIMNFFLI